MEDDGHDPEATPNNHPHLHRVPHNYIPPGGNNHLPNMSADMDNVPSGPFRLPPNRMADIDNPSGRHHVPQTPRMGGMDNPSGRHHLPPNPRMAGMGNPFDHNNNNSHGKQGQFYPQQPPPVDGFPLPQGKPSHRHRRHHSPPPPYGQGGSSSSKAGAFASIATLAILVGLTALILYLVYRPNTPHFTVVAASIYLLNTTTPATFVPPPTASFLATSMQFTVVSRNPNRRTSLHYDHLRAQVYYRGQDITPPTELPPLCHGHRSTVVFSPILGGGEAMPVAPGVVEGLVADEAYGMLGLRLVVMGRVRYKAGFIWTAHYGVYVGCDLLVGVKKEVVGAVPLLANHDCKVDM